VTRQWNCCLAYEDEGGKVRGWKLRADTYGIFEAEANTFKRGWFLLK
jgi:hypothetical protein